jgi:hypothetical protein
MENKNYEIEEIKKLIADVTKLQDVIDMKQYETLMIHLNDQKRIKEKELEKVKIRKEKKKEKNEMTYEKRLNQKVHCECCDLEIDRYCMKAHLLTEKHKKNAYSMKMYD